MGSKVRCPACGAKNDAASHRCRMCTAVINADAARPTEEPVAEVAPMDDHFDAGVIDRQLQPTRSKFGDDSGGLAARLAAARAAKAAGQPVPADPTDRAAPAADSSTVPLPGGPAATAWSDDPISAVPAPPPPPTAPSSRAASPDEPFVPVDLTEMQARQAPPTAPPIEHEAEPFDPDALFRDMK